MANMGRRHGDNYLRNETFVTHKIEQKKSVQILMCRIFLDLTTSVAGNSTLMTSGEQLGCPKDRFDWCQTLSSMNVYVYYLAFTLVVGAAWPLVNITFYTILANSLNNQSQKHQQSLNFAIGQSARLLSPIFIGLEGDF